MSDDVVNIEVDGKPVEARRGQMIIEATDAIGTYIPRFCYHEKLSIAANCRMCLVEVEKAPKPLPACATPITEGMKVFTRSPYAIAAQKATMEFLLINHPLDCPICDQGGECELQDLAVGYGRDVSRYNDGKRVVKDKNIGPLVSTDMTRCIHCTRCVRFGQEIAGIPQLGTTERGENMKIGTYIEQSVDHELSGNIIDLCPVGALNNKPYRYSARAWEMTQKATVSPHDCVGSNMYAHVLRGTVKRIVPRENESINETWLADRDRFSYEAIYSDDRLQTPKIKHAGEWRDIDWEEALATVAEAIRKAAADKVGILASPWVTAEEAHLLSGIASYVGTSNIDYRIRQRDFSDQGNDPLYPWLGCEIAEVEEQNAILLVGSNIRHEAPILAHRVRKAALAGARVSFVNSGENEYFFDVANSLSGDGLVAMLAGVAVAACGKALPDNVAALCDGVEASADQQKIAESLKAADKALVLLGNIAGRHRAMSAVRALGAVIANATGATFGSLSEGPNSAGAALAGVLPHRGLGGVERAEPGLHAGEMPGADLDVLMLVNVEPDADILATDDAVSKIGSQNFTVALTPFVSEALLEAADLLLPVGTFAESSGTFVNAAGTWQSFPGIANPVGEARPAWKVLRVIGNLLDAPGFEYVSSEDVLAELREQLGQVDPGKAYAGTTSIARPNGADAPSDDVDIPIYSIDPVVRRARALQLTEAARRARGEGEEQ
jgi:NADH-quinone oxidoreductase subunit G